MKLCLLKLELIRHVFFEKLFLIWTPKFSRHQPPHLPVTFKPLLRPIMLVIIDVMTRRYETHGYLMSVHIKSSEKSGAVFCCRSNTMLSLVPAQIFRVLIAAPLRTASSSIHQGLHVSVRSRSKKRKISFLKILMTADVSRSPWST